MPLEYQSGLTVKRGRSSVDAMKGTCGQPGAAREGAGRPRAIHTPEHRVNHRGAHRRIIDSIAWISDLRDASSFTRSMIFWTAEITVVWCLPPNARARSG